MTSVTFSTCWFGSLIVVFGIIAVTTMSDNAYAQTDNAVYTSQQNAISENLENNPIAQDILKKIEQTKKWIEELEQRNYRHLERHNELEEKRQQALAKLNHDLAEWEKLWEFYSPRNSFERFVNKIPDSQVQGVFWDQFEFKEQKVKAGRDALKKVIADGGSLHDARQAYLAAAETKRIELIEANSQFNVRHNLAYYNQQILFDREGQFVDSPITGEQLRKYYEDFRTNPAYLEANPDDAVSWEEFGRTNADTECIKGKVVVYRFHARDYVCVTMSTAELWIQHGMGEITGKKEDKKNTKSNFLSDKQYVTPITRCDDGFRVVYTLDAGKYSCVLEGTASRWIEQGIADFHDPEDYIMQSIERKEAHLRIEEINQKIREIEKNLEDEKMELKKRYDLMYSETQVESKEAEKKVIKDFSDGNISNEQLSRKISDIREDLKSNKEKILRDKVNDTKKLERTYEKKMKGFAQEYDLDPYIKVVLNSGKIEYEAVLRE